MEGGPYSLPAWWASSVPTAVPWPFSHPRIPPDSHRAARLVLADFSKKDRSPTCYLDLFALPLPHPPNIQAWRDARCPKYLNAHPFRTQAEPQAKADLKILEVALGHVVSSFFLPPAW